MFENKSIYGEIMVSKLLICVFAIALNISLASAAALNVGQGQTYATIQSAVNAATEGDVISVSEGTYLENVVIKKNGISLIGKNKEKTVIDAKKTGSGIRIEANNVKVSGFTVQNSGGSGQEDAGITLYRANNNMVANVILANNVVGISLYSGSNSNIVSGNEIKSNGKYGIFVFSSSDNRIYNNNVQSNKFGFYGDGARTNRIYSNNFIDNTDQAYDNSGKNSWENENSGNYWSTHKVSGAYNIPGGAGAKDNYPLSRPVTIKEEEISVPAEKAGEAAKPTPGFTGLVVLVSLISIAMLKGSRNRR